MKRVMLRLLPLLAACGSEDEARGPSSLASAYIGHGVVRVDRTDTFEASLRAFAFELRDVQISGGQVTGQARHLDGEAFAVRGTFNVDENQVRFVGAPGALTSPEREQVVRFGFRTEDGIPTDDIASELVGFVDTATAASTATGRWVGVEERPDLVASPDLEKIAIYASERAGRFVVEGSDGASPGGAGLQLIRFSLELDVPTDVTTPVEFSGAFLLDIEALPGDVLLLRARVSGRAGPSVAVVVPPS